MIRTLLILLTLILIGGCSYKEDETNDIYLIPNGFEGSILVLYDVPNQPALKKKENIQ